MVEVDEEVLEEEEIPLEQEDEDEFVELTPSFALERAAAVLEAAAEIANRILDPEQMLNVAAGWIELHDRMDPEQGEKHPIGFGSCKVKEVEDGGTDEPTEKDSGEGESRLHPQHGKLRVGPVRYRYRGRSASGSKS